MATNYFNNARSLDNISIGGYVPYDVYTKALWIFDGTTTIDGYIKDRSENENHLIPSSDPKFSFMSFGKVLHVDSGISFTSVDPIAVSEDGPQCVEIFFSNYPENLETVGQPFPYTYSGINAGANGNISSFITECRIETGTNRTASLCIGRAGTIQRLAHTDGASVQRDFILPVSVTNSNRYQQSTSPVLGEPYVNGFYPKNWFALAINYESSMSASDKQYYWLNGNRVQMESGNSLNGPLVSDVNNFKLFPYPEFNFTHKIAYIRVSNKLRTPNEIQQMLNYFSNADGYFKNFKVYNRPQSKYQILRNSAESVLSHKDDLTYGITSRSEIIRSGITSSSVEVNQTVNIVHSGAPVFEFDSYGASKGALIEVGKENYFKYDSGAGAYKSDFSNGAARWYPTAAELNFDSCTQPVHGDYYGYSGPDTFNYWNLTGTDLICSGIYTMSCWVKKTDRVTDNGFYMTLSRHGTSNWLYVYPYVEVIDAHPLFDKVDYAYSATNKVNFKFSEGEHYSDWQRLWVTFKIYTDQVTNNYWQITHDNRVGASTAGQGDTWAIDCHQFEEGWLSSWYPEYEGDDSITDCSLNIDVSDTIDPNVGTIIFDYRTNATYSGLAEIENMLYFGDETNRIAQVGNGILYTSTDGGGLLTSKITRTDSPIRIALTWNTLNNSYIKLYRLDTAEIDYVQTASLAGMNITNIYSSSSGTHGSHFIKNVKLFQRDLTLDELSIYR